MCSDIVPGNSVTPGNKQAEPESATNGEKRRGGRRGAARTHSHAQTPLLSESEISSSSSRNQQWSVFKAKGGGGDAAIHNHSWKAIRETDGIKRQGQLSEEISRVGLSDQWQPCSKITLQIGLVTITHLHMSVWMNEWMTITAHSDREKEKRRERFILVPWLLSVAATKLVCCGEQRISWICQRGFCSSKAKINGIFRSFLPSINQMDAALEKLDMTRVENNQQPDNTSPSSNPIACTKWS